MSSRNFTGLLEAREELGNSVCVGLDSDLEKIPEAAVRGSAEATLVGFSCDIVDATHDLVLAYKPNAAFFEDLGDAGFRALHDTIVYINQVAPAVPVILDAKRGDIGNTNEGYVRMAFEYLGVDAITVHPFLGGESLAPFLVRNDKGIFVLCRTSNPGAGEFQDRRVHPTPEEAEAWNIRTSDAIPFYELVAYRVANEWNKSGNCGLVVGATFPEELRRVRAITDDMPILIPGVGAQGGDAEQTVLAGRDSRGRGMIINSSRGIIFASKGADFRDAARRETEKLRNLVNQYRTAGVV